MKLVLAIPTIEERGDAWKDVAAAFQKHTCQPVTVVPSWRKGSWAAGLNDVWEQHEDADLFVCGSDDMVPEDDYWLPPLERFLAEGLFPAPKVIDPRFTYPGTWEENPVDGTPSQMSTFPVLKGEWLEKVFPLPEELHYFSDNLIADRLKAHGIQCVACPSSVIIHTCDERGRGAGMGSEDVRMQVDRETYRSLA